MKVSELMTPNPFTVDKDENISVVLQLFNRKEISRLPVVDKDYLVGVITKTDLAEGLGSRSKEGLKLGRMYVSSFMTKQPHIISPSASEREATRIMIKEGISGLPVVDGEKLVGILSKTDLLKVCTDSKKPLAGVLISDPPVLSPQDSVLKAFRLFIEGNPKMVVRHSGTVIGVLTDWDLVNAFGTFRKLIEARHMSERIQSMLVEEIMTPEPTTIDVNCTVGDCSVLLLEKNIDSMPVMDGESLVGLVSSTGIIGTIME